MEVATVPNISVDQIIHVNVSWEVYRALVTSLGDDGHARIAYDGETLEIMSPGPKHERIANLVSDLLPFVMDEWGIDYANTGQTTFQLKESYKGGFEADKSYYIASLERVRDFNNIDLSTDPPPDLVVEVDITHRRLNKQELYANIGVSEFWRYDEDTGLLAFALIDGAYTRLDVSRVIQGLPLVEIAKIIVRERNGDSRRAIINDWKQWLRDNRNLHGLD